MFTWFTGLALSLALDTTAPAEAGWRLRWDAPAGCPAGDEVRATIERTIGDKPTSALSAEATVERVDDTQWRLTLRVDGASGSGTRTLSAANCGELADASALIVAIAIAPELAAVEVPEVELPQGEPEQPAEREPEREPTPEPASAPEPDPEIVEVSVPEVEEVVQTRKRSRRVRGYSRAGVGSGLGVLPGPTLAVAAEIGAFGRFWQAGLGASFWLPRRASAPQNPAVGGSFSLWSLQPSGCGVPAIGAISFPLCLGASLGAVRGTGTGALAVSETASAFWSAIQASAGVGWSSRVVGAWLQLSALAALNRPVFRTVQTPLVFESGAFGGQVVGGIELRFP